MRLHTLVRISPKGPGEIFIGRCTCCDATEVTQDRWRNEECPNTEAKSQDQALIELLKE
jgi:hypothetical protein